MAESGNFEIPSPFGANFQNWNATIYVLALHKFSSCRELHPKPKVLQT